MDSLYIVMPAYNEEANIENVIAQWHPVVEKIGGASRLVVLNDGSRDGTGQKLEECKKKFKRLTVINKANEGHGPTVLRGYHYAIDSGADFVFQVDTDGQTLPEEFWEFWRNRQKCGLLIGYRKKREDGFSRLVVTRVLRLVLFFCFHEWIKDANTPYRLMRASQLKRVLQKVPDDFYLANVLVTVVYKKHHCNVEYYPITFRPRQGGTNSIDFKKIVKIGKSALGDFWAIRKKI